VVSQRARAKRSRLFGEPLFTCFSSLPAGVDLGPLVISNSSPVQLRIRGPSLGLVHFARLFPAQPREFLRRVAESSQTIRTSGPWLAASTLGEEAHDRPEGTWISVVDHGSGTGEIEVALGEPGWYQVRVECEGRATLATELYYFEAGEHELVFDPPEAAELHGRLFADGAHEFFGLQVADDNGRPLARVQPIRASGEFRVRELGAGRYRLRFGSLDELAEGRFRREIVLDVVPGENPPLEVRF